MVSVIWSRLYRGDSEVGALVLVDACQAACHARIDFEDLEADYMAFSGHKLYGPTGVGCLLVSDRGYEALRKRRFCGGAVECISDNLEIETKSGFCLSLGTLPIAQIVGLAEAVNFMNEVGIDQILNMSKTCANTWCKT